MNVDNLFKIAKPRSEKALKLAQERKIKRMQLNDVITNLPDELYKALEEYGMSKQLKVGDKFQQTFNGRLIFEILDIKPEKNWCKVIVINPLNHFQHIEDWDDLHIVYQSLSINDYKLI